HLNQILISTQTKKATPKSGLLENWLRELDLNQRPSGYEPDELPDCSIPRRQFYSSARGCQTISQKNSFSLKYLAIERAAEALPGRALEPLEQARAAVSSPATRTARASPITMPQRKIIHIDCDCFYAAIEMRDDPSLAGKPLAVGG